MPQTSMQPPWVALQMQNSLLASTANVSMGTGPTIQPILPAVGLAGGSLSPGVELPKRTPRSSK